MAVIDISINTWSPSWPTLNEHLNWYSVDTRLACSRLLVVGEEGRQGQEKKWGKTKARLVTPVSRLSPPSFFLPLAFARPQQPRVWNRLILGQNFVDIWSTPDRHSVDSWSSVKQFIIMYWSTLNVVSAKISVDQGPVRGIQWGQWWTLDHWCFPYPWSTFIRTIEWWSCMNCAHIAHVTESYMRICINLLSSSLDEK